MSYDVFLVLRLAYIQVLGASVVYTQSYDMSMLVLCCILLLDGDGAYGTGYCYF